MPRPSYSFDPLPYLPALEPLLGELLALCKVERSSGPSAEQKAVAQLLRRYPKGAGETFSKSDLLSGLRYLEGRAGRDPEASPLFARLRKKPLRTASGVATVTVLTRPHPCPGQCIFCPNDVRMPKSYLSSEPGSQRAEQHGFDPYLQTWFRLRALANNGHPLDKVELIVLGGTWSFYPEAYQIWFIKRTFDALNEFTLDAEPPACRPPSVELPESPLATEKTYNRTVTRYLAPTGGLRRPGEAATWQELEAAQRRNEAAGARCVGLALETRPDHLDPQEALHLRRLGATKIQIGLQSTSDRVLAANRRGHDLAAAQRAMGLLRTLGFKLHAHWMPNLLGSTPGADRRDYERLWSDPALRPDELKIYPCSLIEGTELMDRYREGTWKPYTEPELLDLLVHCLERAPAWTRLTRVVRDIPSHDIVAGNKKTNFRQIAAQELARRGGRGRDIRAREIRRTPVRPENLRIEALEYATTTGREVFLQAVTAGGRLGGFLRLSLPQEGHRDEVPEELRGRALIREVHVYGPVAPLQGPAAKGRAQHGGLGRRLVAEAETRARKAGYQELAVISAVGTRGYYRALGFCDGALYQHRSLGGRS